MICDEVIWLISEDPSAHGAFDKPRETTRMCYCRVESVTRSEYYKAKEHNAEPLFVFVLSEFADYCGEKIVLFRGERYRVIRSFTKNNAVQLTVGKVTADA